jgi:hypothetical protein
VVVNYAPAETYWIWVDGSSTASAGSFTLDVTLEPPILPPSNDLCSGAVPLVKGQPVTGNTTTALQDYGTDPPYSPACAGSSVKPLGNDLVYSYTPQASGPFTALLTGSGKFRPLLWYTIGVCGESAACEAIVQAGTALTIEGVAGAVYYFIVDENERYDGMHGNFTNVIN